MNSIQLKAVSFSREQPLFEKTNLAIPQGTFSLLIGDSGSGDSDIMMTDTINPLKSKFKASTKLLNKTI